MGTYQVPRNVKGEGRILFIFSTKALMYTAIGLGVGFVFKIIFGIVHLDIIGYIIMGLLGLAGFIVGTLKMPNTNSFEITKKTGGENIDDIIKRAIKFQRSGKKIYVYEKKENLKKVSESTNEERGGKK